LIEHVGAFKQLDRQVSERATQTHFALCFNQEYKELGLTQPGAGIRH